MPVSCPDRIASSKLPVDVTVVALRMLEYATVQRLPPQPPVQMDAAAFAAMLQVHSRTAR